MHTDILPAPPAAISCLRVATARDFRVERACRAGTASSPCFYETPAIVCSMETSTVSTAHQGLCSHQHWTALPALAHAGQCTNSPASENGSGDGAAACDTAGLLASDCLHGDDCAADGEAKGLCRHATACCAAGPLCLPLTRCSRRLTAATGLGLDATRAEWLPPALPSCALQTTCKGWKASKPQLQPPGSPLQPAK